MDQMNKEILKSAIVEAFAQFQLKKIIKNELLKAINEERWITIKPHGEDSEDYRRLKLEDGESPKEAIDRVYKKNKDNKKEKTVEELKTESLQYTFFRELVKEQKEAEKIKSDWIMKIEKVRELEKNDEKLKELNKIAEEKRKELFGLSYSDPNWQEKNREHVIARSNYSKRLSELNKEVGIFEAQEKYQNKQEELIEKKYKEFKEASEKIGDRLKEISKGNDVLIKNIESKIPKDYLKAIEELKKAEDIKDQAYKKYDANTDWLSEEKKSLRKEYYIATDKVAEATKKVTKYKEEVANIVGLALKIENGVELKLNPNKTQVENANRLKKVLDGVIPIEVYSNKGMNIETTSGRAYHSGQTIKLNKNSKIETIIHETMHQLEENNIAMLANSLAFAEYRTKDEKQIALKKVYPNRAYGAKEICKQDKFFNAYCGKFYNMSGGKNQEYRKSHASEIMSMGMQELFTNPIGFAQNDREYFDFVIANIRGIL